MGRAGGRGGGGGSRGGSFGGSRGGSFGGGGRSSRSSSSGSFSRSSSSFGSSRSYTSSSSNRTSGGSFWGPRTTGPVIINNSGNRTSSGGYGGYNNKTRPVYNSSGNSSGSNNNQQNNIGCIHIALIIVMIMSILVLLFNTVLLVTSSKEQRTPLAKGAVIETGYYTDELDWINDESDLLTGMKYFYKETGVQPYLYITDDVGGNFYDKVEDFAHDKYDELFEDEGHLLFIFWEQDYYNTYCLSGIAADTVVDADAREILLDKIDEYYWDSSLDEDAYFSKAFSEAADEIMAEPPSAFVSVLIPLIIFAAALIAEIMIRKKAKDAQREKELKEMLEKPLETFGDTEAQELAKKYENTKTENKEETAKTEAEVKPKPSEKTDISESETKTETENTKPEENNYINICTTCGNSEPMDHNYCSKCGTRLR